MDGYLIMIGCKYIATFVFFNFALITLSNVVCPHSYQPKTQEMNFPVFNPSNFYINHFKDENNRFGVLIRYPYIRNTLISVSNFNFNNKSHPIFPSGEFTFKNSNLPKEEYNFQEKFFKGPNVCALEKGYKLKTDFFTTYKDCQRPCELLGETIHYSLEELVGLNGLEGRICKFMKTDFNKVKLQCPLYIMINYLKLPSYGQDEQKILFFIEAELSSSLHYSTKYVNSIESISSIQDDGHFSSLLKFKLQDGVKLHRCFHIYEDNDGFPWKITQMNLDKNEIIIHSLETRNIYKGDLKIRCFFSLKNHLLNETIIFNVNGTKNEKSSILDLDYAQGAFYYSENEEMVPKISNFKNLYFRVCKDIDDYKFKELTIKTGKFSKPIIMDGVINVELFKQLNMTIVKLNNEKNCLAAYFNTENLSILFSNPSSYLFHGRMISTSLKKEIYFSETIQVESEKTEKGFIQFLRDFIFSPYGVFTFVVLGFFGGGIVSSLLICSTLCINIKAQKRFNKVI